MLTKKLASTLMYMAACACLYTGSTGIAAACACTPFSTSLSMQQDGVNVYATATMSLSYLCQGTAEATVTAPDSTQAFNLNEMEGGGDPISTTASYAIGYQDGTYGGLGNFYYDGTDTGQGQGQYTPKTSQQFVGPFVQLIDTSFTGSPIAKVSGSGTFTVSVITSLNCSGLVSVAGNITHPNNMHIQISANIPEGNGVPSGDTALGSFQYGTGQQHQFSYTVATGADNGVGSASGSANGYVYAWPSGCSNNTTVPSGHKSSQDFSVGP